MGEAADSLKGRQALQKDLDKSVRWATINHMRFNKVKCWILHQGRSKPGFVSRSGNKTLESSTAGRDLGVLDNSNLNKSH